MQNYTICSDHLSATFSPRGAELTSLQKNGKEYVYQKTEGFWQRQSPILFPIVGALSGSQYEHDGKIYTLSQHGFIRDREFSLVEHTEDSIAFSVSSDGQTREMYPFDFRFFATYGFEDNVLKVEYRVENLSRGALYFSLGGHPALSLEGDVSEYSVYFSHDAVFERDILKDWLLDNCETINIQNNELFLSEEIFSRDALIFRRLASEEIVLRKNGKDYIRLYRGNMPHFALWKEPSAPFLCMEPWSGFASLRSVDTPEKLAGKPWIVHLEPGTSVEFSWSLELP